MADTLLLKTHKNPSLLNRDMALGALLGALVPGIWPVTAVIGGLVGGFFGKRRIEKDNTHGKEAKSPSFWNKKTLIGALAGLHIGSLVALGTGAAVLGASVLTGAPLETEAVGLGQLFTGLGAMLVPMVLGPVVGGFIGGHAGKKEMQRDYVQALEQYREQAQVAGRAPEQAQAMGMEAPGKNYAAQIEHERQLAAQQQRTL